MRAILVLLVACAWLCPSPAASAECPPPRARVSTVVGLTLCVDPSFEATIADQVGRVRGEIGRQREAGKLILYLSTPVGAQKGGRERIDLEVAKAVKTRLERELGDRVWVLNPHEYPLAPLDGRAPGPEEHMLLWTYVLAGNDGLGRDLDMAYFTGPSAVP